MSEYSYPRHVSIYYRHDICIVHKALKIIEIWWWSIPLFRSPDGLARLSVGLGLIVVDSTVRMSMSSDCQREMLDTIRMQYA